MKLEEFKRHMFVYLNSQDEDSSKLAFDILSSSEVENAFILTTLAYKSFAPHYLYISLENGDPFHHKYTDIVDKFCKKHKNDIYFAFKTQQMYKEFREMIKDMTSHELNLVINTFESQSEIAKCDSFNESCFPFETYSMYRMIYEITLELRRRKKE